ncbi:hypothetical protein H4Q26_006327 [Puccinia striiformis f. sp. tritici PST-130]|nr:hypothetical protein H4Q26_006327 [Puccinia striiformis f. sp. tritici PST-130]
MSDNPPESASVTQTTPTIACRVNKKVTTKSRINYHHSHSSSSDQGPKGHQMSKPHKLDTDFKKTQLSAFSPFFLYFLEVLSFEAPSFGPWQEEGWGRRLFT